MTTSNLTIISSFFFYMWNAWSEKECEAAFKDSECGSQHLWGKWCSICDRFGVHGTAERFFAELSEPNRLLLVNRACQLYDGRHRKSN